MYDRLAESWSERKGECNASLTSRDVSRKEESSDKGYSAHDILEVTAERENERKQTGEGMRETPFLSSLIHFIYE